MPEESLRGNHTNNLVKSYIITFLTGHKTEAYSIPELITVLCNKPIPVGKIGKSTIQHNLTNLLKNKFIEKRGNYYYLSDKK